MTLFACFHCGEDIQTTEHYSVLIGEKEHQMCCLGCEAIAQTIVDNGLSSYYEFRTENAEKSSIIPDELRQFDLYDHEDIEIDFVRFQQKHQQDYKEVTLSIEGMVCSACAWLLETRLNNENGVVCFRVNASTNRGLLSWDPNETKLSTLLHSIHQIGYRASPFEADKQEAHYQKTLRQYLYRLGIAGIATMQVMMIAIALYFEVFSDLDSEFKSYLRWVSALFATPVLMYSAFPFYQNAWRSLKARTLSMDVPVSLALLFAYIASLYATWFEQGEVFFESISMFTFFLLIGRYLELRARHVSAAFSANLLKLIPAMATLSNGEAIAVKRLCVGDTIIVKAGDTVPADGVITTGTTQLNESMLTGESRLISKTTRDTVFTGTINTHDVITVTITTKKNDSLLARIIQWQDEAHVDKPKIVLLADAVARYFVFFILVIASVTFSVWFTLDPDQALWVTLSVLVATCPCALSLATPTALTSATSRLSKMGILLKHAHVLETLCRINHVIVDKTGTLTQGNVKIIRTDIFDKTYDENTILNFAAALEKHANHPIAHAFSNHLTISSSLTSSKIETSNITNHLAQGVQGQINGQTWRIGHAQFSCPSHQKNNSYSVWLSCEYAPIAAFVLDDPLRPDSQRFIEYCRKAKLSVSMLTGDHSHHAQAIGNQVNIHEIHSGMTPEGKLAYLRQLPTSDITLMIGDGMNDAPVLAGAHLSVSMGSGTDLAKSSADIVLLRDQLSSLIIGQQLALKTKRIIQQNLAWALGYNLIILPLAVCGLVPPYLAVVGMSLSSLIVVGNSLRLLK